MNKSDKERLKKIISLWNALNEEIKKRNITQELLLNDQFAQWAVTTPGIQYRRTGISAYTGI